MLQLLMLIDQKYLTVISALAWLEPDGKAKSNVIITWLEPKVWCASSAPPPTEHVCHTQQAWVFPAQSPAPPPRHARGTLRSRNSHRCSARRDRTPPWRSGACPSGCRCGAPGLCLYLIKTCFSQNILLLYECLKYVRVTILIQTIYLSYNMYQSM